MQIIFHKKLKPLIINLDFIHDHSEEQDKFGNFLETYNEFNSHNDIVDNANKILKMDDYSVINCFAEILTKEASLRIYKNHSKK